MNQQVEIIPLDQPHDPHKVQALVRQTALPAGVQLTVATKAEINQALQADYHAANAARIIRRLRVIAQTEPLTPGTLTLTWDAHKIEVMALPDGSTVASINGRGVLDNRKPGNEYLVLHDGAWLTAVLTYGEQRDLAIKTQIERQTLLADEQAVTDVLKPY